MRTTSRVLLPLLLLLSGFCGISYEILYTKLLGNLLGNQFTINATVLLTFLLGIGLGTLYAHRFVRWLWVVEAGIGAYAALLLAGYDQIDHLLYTQLPALGTSLLACSLVSVVLLAPPAFLVGCSVPLFAAYLSTLRSTHVFSTTYGIYNIGAALTALTMEFVLLRWLGLRGSTLSLAALNGLVAVGLLLLVRRAPLIPAPRADRLWFAGRDVAGLVLASVASAIFQLLMIKVAECILGPFNETFALVLATVLLGLALGSVAVGRLRLSFAGALIAGLAGVLLLLASYGYVGSLYAAAYPSAVESYPLLVLLKFTLVLALMGLPALGFGATIPALLRTHRDVARESGQLLFFSSLANVLGFLLMAFVLHRWLDYGPVLLIIASLTLAGLLVHAGPWRFVSWTGGLLFLAAVAAHQGLWSEWLLYVGHDKFHSTRRLEKARRSDFSMERFTGYQDVFAITHIDGKSYFFINGYVSIPLTAAAEKVAGALSVMAAPRTDEALVLGIGSGATAGTVGLLFDHTEAVEINKVIIDNLYRMADYNFDVEHMPGVEIIHDDGIHYAKTTRKQYSLIVNTVTTPIYFSSSKLYTREFLDRVIDRLTPDGVYTTWVDQDLGDEGVDIILETLDGAFEQCWLSYLKSSYYLLLCSNAELRPHQVGPVSKNPELARYLAGHDHLPSRWIPYSLLLSDVLGLDRPEATSVNTLDLPVLEHEMARLKRGRILGFNRRLEDALNLHEMRRLFRESLSWTPAEFAVWADLRLNRGVTLWKILDDAVPRQFGEPQASYGEAALRAAAELGSADAYYRYGTLIYDREDHEYALEAFSRAARIDPTSRRARYYVGRCHEELGRLAEARRHYLAVLELDPDYDRAREALARVTDPR